MSPAYCKGNKENKDNKIDSSEWNYHGGLVSVDKFADNCHYYKYTRK